LNEPRGLSRVFVAMQYRDYRLLFFSHIATALGSEFLQVSNAWQIYSLTGSAFALGLTGVFRAIPVLGFSLIGGVIADRVDRRKIIVLTQTTHGFMALALALDCLLGTVEVWHIYGVIFLNNTLSSASMPARRAVLATIVPRQHLMNAMSLNSLMSQADKIGAPALAGVLIEVAGTPLTYAMNGLLVLVNAVTLAFIKTDLVPNREPASPGRDLVEGLSFVRAHPIILVMLLMDSAAMIVGNYIVLLPVIATNFGVGAVGFGMLGSAQSVGRLGAAITLMSLGDFRHKGYVIGFALLAFAGFLMLLAVAPIFPIALVAVAGLGLTDGLQAQTRNVLIQLLTPNALRGRVGAFQTMLQGGVPSLGQGILGAAAAALTVPVALFGAGVICGAVNLAIFIGRKDLRAIDLGRDPEPVPATREAAVPVRV
jgi:MFS family permease